MSAGILERIDADLIEPHRVAASVVDQLQIDRRRGLRQSGRGITAREALLALRFEAQLVAVAAENIAAGMPLTSVDHARVLVAWALIETVYCEAIG